LNVDGSAGISGICWSTTETQTSLGGGTAFGALKTSGGNAASDTNGLTGASYGGGGSGGRTSNNAANQSGGAGAAGVVIVWEFVTA
jgi:hypothetical protein